MFRGGGAPKSVLGKRSFADVRRSDVRCDAFCRKKLNGRLFFIRKSNARSAQLVRVKEVLPPDEDQVIRVELQSMDKVDADRNYDSDDDLMEDDPDYLLTIEDLMLQNDIALANRDLVPRAIVNHAFDNLQAMVQVKWNTGHKSWESVSDMKSHAFDLLLRYATANKLENTAGWRWASRITAIQRRIKLRAAALGESFDAEAVFRRVATKHKKDEIKFGRVVPRNINHALLIDLEDETNSRFWEKAMDKEMRVMEKNKVFRMLPRGQRPPKGYQFAPLHMVYDVKEGGVGKARFVAGGHVVDSSRYAIYASVLKSEHFRMLLAIADANQLHVVTGDIGGAYLNARTSEKVYSIAGKQFKEDEGRVILIEKALYGLRTSAAQWWKHLAGTLRSIGFQNSSVDDNVWMHPVLDDENNVIRYDYICVHVDDFAVFSKDPTKHIKALQEIYTVRHVTPIVDCTFYLGMDLKRDTCFRGFLLAVRTYITEALQELTKLLGFCRKRKTPLDPNVTYEVAHTACLSMEQHAAYRSAVGIFQWISCCGRIDITYAARLLSRFSAGPLVQHWDGCRHLAGYLRHCKSFALPIHHKKIPSDPSSPIDIKDSLGETQLFKELYPEAKEEVSDSNPTPCYGEISTTCYVDSDWAGDKSHRRSVTGYIIYLGSTPVTWYCKTQSMVETSTYSAEFMAMKKAVEHIKGLRHTLRAFGVVVESPTEVRCDNKSVVSDTVIAASTLRNRQIGIAYHMCRESVAADIIRVYHIKSEFNRADILTKPLGSVKHQALIDRIFKRGQFGTKIGRPKA